MKLKPAVMTLWATDVNRLAGFYRDVLGLPLLTMDRGRPHFDLGGAYLVVLPGRRHKIPNSLETQFPVLAFAVDDLDAVVH